MVPKSPTPKSPPSRKKDDSFLGKLGGTLARRKKAKEGKNSRGRERCRDPGVWDWETPLAVPGRASQCPQVASKALTGLVSSLGHRRSPGFGWLLSQSPGPAGPLRSPLGRCPRPLRARGLAFAKFLLESFLGRRHSPLSAFIGLLPRRFPGAFRSFTAAGTGLLGSFAGPLGLCEQ